MLEKKIGRYASVKYDDTGLKNLLAGIKENYVVRVGILGAGAKAHERKESGELKKSGGHKKGEKASEQTNADIGLAHEVGIKSRNLPRRSWLVTPLEDHLGEYFNKLGAVVIKQMIVKQGIGAYNQLGVACMQIISGAFATGGYGKWPDIKQATKDRKKSDMILIDTGQFSGAVHFKVVTK